MSSLLQQLKNFASPATMRALWSKLKLVPGGGKVMGRLIGQMAPYTGTIHAEIVALDLGYSKVRMNDARRVRNHLNCIHAVALMNLGELTTGAAMMYSMPENTRSIITNLSMEYLKKARGTLTGECSCEVPAVTSEKREYVVSADLKNEAGEVVARAHARWLVSPAA